jgi:hypothetical protein
MTAITFPTDPANDSLYTAPNGCVYIWDGEKWVVNSTIYTGPALENISQDRVAPMFVNGVNTGITFAYNATTNTLTSTVTAGTSVADFGEGFSLDNADKIVTNKLYSTNQTQPTQHYRLELDTNGVVILPDQSIINGATLKTVPGNYAGITAGPASPAGKDEDSWVWVDNNGATIATKYSTDNYQWKFNNTGALSYPNNALQRDTGTVTCLGNASTVVYTGSASYQTTIKLLIQVEGNVGAAVDWDTQSCEMIIAKSWRANVVASSVYAVVHTSAAPLATFSAEWNALTSRIQVLCATPSANSVYVRTFATEITTAD